MHILLRPDRATAAMTLAGGGHGLNVLLVTPRHVSSQKAWHGAENGGILYVQRCPLVPPSQMGFIPYGNSHQCLYSVVKGSLQDKKAYVLALLEANAKDEQCQQKHG